MAAMQVLLLGGANSKCSQFAAMQEHQCGASDPKQSPLERPFAFQVTFPPYSKDVTDDPLLPHLSPQRQEAHSLGIFLG